MFIDPERRADLGQLRELIKSSSTVGKFINYFEKSEILRFFVLSQFKEKIMLDKKLIEMEINEG